MIFFEFLFFMIFICDIIGIAGLSIVLFDSYLITYDPSSGGEPT